MIATPIVPHDPSEQARFLREYLGQIAEIMQTLGEGQSYPNSDRTGKAQYWDDYTTSFNAGKSIGVNAPTWAAIRGNISGWQFSATQMNEVFLAPIHITHTYKPNTPIYPHIHWICPTTNTGVVRWGIEYTIAKGHQQGGVFPAPTTIYLEQAATGNAYEHQIVEVTTPNAISDPAIEVDSLMMMRVFRDAAHVNDTCTAAVFGVMVDAHYQKSYWATKNKAPNFYK